MAHDACELRIGTSGWHYAHWKGTFYPQDLGAGEMLAYYARHFDAVEINNCFYRLPKVGSLVNWRDTSPAGFCFAAKASRFLTHNKKLKDPENALQNFLPLIETLGPKLGPILFQLPPKWRCNTERLEEFLSALPCRHRYAFEFREPSWICGANFELPRRYNAAFCIYELAGYHSPFELTADWAYVRLHGPRGKYQGSYSDRKLLEWAARVRKWRPNLRAIHVYFDNDQAGYAPRNALHLRELLGMQELCAA